ncbi:MAG: class I SAM-dependent methyltransferase [Actinomycetota bacterium]
MLTIDYTRLGLSSGETLLDLGCGAGRHAFEALRRGAHTVAVDLDDAALKDVRALGSTMISQGETPSSSAVDCVCADALRLPCPEDTFDRIVASEVLEHIVDDRQAIGEIARVLRPGGTVAVTVPRRWPERLCWTLSSEYHENAGGHVRIYRASDLIDRFEGVGFFVYARHHAHAFHSPYWWLKCIVGPSNDDALPVRLYRRALEWQIRRGPRLVDAAERALNPLMGKSLVLYFVKHVA